MTQAQHEWTLPTLHEAQEARVALAGVCVRTPSVEVIQDQLTPFLPQGSTAHIKLELLQRAGAFKARGAYLAVAALSEQQRRAGVVAVSGGNHAIAVSWAAKQAGVHAKICLPQTADPYRIKMCEDLGADVLLSPDIAQAFAQTQQIEADEGRAMLHPFESRHMTLGAMTCALELLDDVPDVEALVVPIGGGGLISGMALAAKLTNPAIQVYGVEPTGASTLTQAMKEGSAGPISEVKTIADSLGAPMSMPFSFSIIQNHVDDIVTVEDSDLRWGMDLLNQGLKIMPEPACAASYVGTSRRLGEQLAGKRIGLIACGANIGRQRFSELLEGA